MTGRSSWRIAAVLAALAPFRAQAQPATFRLQLSDVRQAQFAGYYVAQSRGFYAAAGLAVTIIPGAPLADSTPPDPAATVDAWSSWMPAALARRGAIINIAQIFPHSGLELVCRKASFIHSPADFRGKTIAVWQDGSQVPFLAWMRKLGLSIPGDVDMLAIARATGPAGIAPLLNRDAACITALNYDQYWALIASGMAPAELQVFHYGDAGVATLQDGLYATPAALADPIRATRLVQFLRASFQGWKYAVAHQPEAVATILDDGKPHDQADRDRATRMLSAVARLTESGLQPMGYLEPAAYDRTVQLLAQARQPVPAAIAWTHDVWQRAR